MAMVPTFQGGLPQVQDSGRSGAATLQAPVSLDYESMMKTALTPVREFANSAQKALEVQHARIIKAESDDAERAVMDVINRHMNDPEVGYLTKMGKAAMDDYQPFMESMEKDVNDVLGGLDPMARQAVGSRVADRLQAATNQAQRWNAQQTQRYQLQSSEAKAEAVHADAANHYADPEYLAKSLASIDQELAYQSEMLGWDPQTLKNQKQAHRDKLQADRFSVWSQDDALSALEAFQNTDEKAVSPEIRNRLGNQLFGAAKGVLALELAERYGDAMMSKRDFVKRGVQDGLVTGNPVIDRLSKQQKLDLFTKAYGLSAQRRSERRGTLSKEIENSIATAGDTGADENELRPEQFVEAYGDDEGKERYAAYKSAFDAAAATYSYQAMPNSLIEVDIKNSKPSPGDPDYADKKRANLARIEAAQQILKARRTDPIGAAITTGQYGIEPLNIANTQEMVINLNHRRRVIGELSRDWDQNAPLLSAAEAKALTGALDRANIDERCETLSAIAGAVGADGIGRIAAQLKQDAKKYAYAMSAFGRGTQAGMSVGERYLRGLDAIEQKRVKPDDKAEYGITAQTFELIGDDDEAEGVFVSAESAKAASEIAFGLYGYSLLNGSGDMEKAVEEAVGGSVYAHNGKKVVLPSGIDGDAWFSGDLTDLIEVEAENLGNEKRTFYSGGLAFTAQELSIKLHKLKLQTESVNSDGSVTYSLIYGNDRVYDESGSVFMFDASSTILKGND